jgi:hypothetical protein
MAREQMVLCRKCMTIVRDGSPCGCPPPDPGAKRYAVWFPETRKFLSGDGGGLAWTRSLAEAQEMASGGGAVVDADDFAANWPAYQRGERAPIALCPSAGAPGSDEGAKP